MAVLFLLTLLQDAPCRGEAAGRIVNAMRLSQAFDLSGAAMEYAAAADAGCADAEVVVQYLRGLVAARAADAQFGSPESLQSVRRAAAALESRGKTDSNARVAHAVLRAAIPAAQHERAEMALMIDEMLRLEGVQLEAGLPGLPAITAHEAAGQFWLQNRAWDEAARAFDEAARRIGTTPHVLLGSARAAAGRADTAAACGQYAKLLTWWADRPAPPPEVAEAQAYVKQPQCAPPAARPGTKR